MLILLAIILAVMWILGFAVFHVASAAIHLLIIAAVIAAVVHAVRVMGGGPTVPRAAPPVT